MDLIHPPPQSPHTPSRSPPAHAPSARRPCPSAVPASSPPPAARLQPFAHAADTPPILPGQSTCRSGGSPTCAPRIREETRSPLAAPTKTSLRAVHVSAPRMAAKRRSRSDDRPEAGTRRLATSLPRGHEHGRDRAGSGPGDASAAPGRPGARHALRCRARPGVESCECQCEPARLVRSDGDGRRAGAGSGRPLRARSRRPRRRWRAGQRVLAAGRRPAAGTR